MRPFANGCIVEIDSINISWGDGMRCRQKTPGRFDAVNMHGSSRAFNDPTRIWDILSSFVHLDQNGNKRMRNILKRQMILPVDINPLEDVVGVKDTGILYHIRLTMLQKKRLARRLSRSLHVSVDQSKCWPKSNGRLNMCIPRYKSIIASHSTN